MRRSARVLGTAVALAVLLGACSSQGTDRAAGAGRAAAEVAGHSVDRDGARDRAQPDGGPRRSRGCDAPLTDPAELERAELSVHGVVRDYLVSTPGGDEPLPLVVDLHGVLEGPEVHAEHTALGELGRREGFVTVVPRGRGDPVSWDVGHGDDNDDVDYVEAVIERVSARRCIDESRIYATGLSNGAMLVSILACDRPGRFAAVAPVAGLLPPEGCESERAVPILATHGTADPIVGFNGGAGGLDGVLEGSTSSTPPPDLDGDGHPAALAAWAEHHNCDPSPTDERVAPSVLHRTYRCPRGADVESYFVEGGGHAWPGSEFGRAIESVTGPVTDEIDWNQLAWEFFRHHRLP